MLAYYYNFWLVRYSGSFESWSISVFNIHLNIKRKWNTTGQVLFILFFSESQSSTDTALSSEATTPTQNALSDLRIKQEPPDTIENGKTFKTERDI